MKAYKLTDQNFKTRTGEYNELTWGEGVMHSVTDNSPDLCSDGWIHFYQSPLIAVLLNPVHANIKNPILWECITYGKHKRELLKSGCKSLRTTKQILLPKITLVSKIAFGILCSLEVHKDARYVAWADGWLMGKDRSATAEAAKAAYTYATYAAYTTYAAAKAAYTYATYAAYTTYAAAYVAYAAATSAATYAAKANDAAKAATYAANAAANAKIPFVKLAKQALKIK